MDAEAEQTLSPPALVAPCDAVSVDGREVTFVWDPLEGAERYRLEVAPTARFEDPVIDTEVGSQTAVTVGNQFPTDGETFFWRVRTGSEAGWGEPGEVESFLATTAEEAKEEGLEVDSTPGLQLARAKGDDVDTTQTVGFERQFQKEKERGVAYEGVASSQITGISVSIIVVILTAVAILFGWFEQVSNSVQSATAEAQDYEQLRQAEVEATQQLQQYGVVDEEEGRYRIPIDRAMDLIATEEYQERQQESQ